MGHHRLIRGNETTLHASLKAWYALPDGETEQVVDGYIIDVVKANELVEIQTSNFSALRPKLSKLLEQHVVRVVYPVAVARWILRTGETGEKLSRRKSPRQGSVYAVFDELTSLHSLVTHPNFRLEVVLVQEEQVWRDDGRGSWRRKHWSLAERKLLGVVGQEAFNQPTDFARLLPQELPQEFTTNDLRDALPIKSKHGNLQRLAGRMARALRLFGVIQQIGKRGHAHLYQRCVE